MARASSIWIVQDADGGIVSAFTVKHELARWLNDRDADYLITRVHDGGHWSHKRPVQLNPRTLESAL